MICVQLNGGLGNQMFQYACGRNRAIKHQTELALDTSKLKNKPVNQFITSRDFDLGPFRLKAYVAGSGELKKFIPFYLRFANFLAFKLGYKGITTSKLFIEQQFSYNSKIERTGRNCFLSGYWQSFKYFQDTEAIIRTEFSFPEFSELRNKEFEREIRNANSVSLHIRRTDFIDNKSHDIHGACSIQYYEKAVDYISTVVENPVFFIFSDDIEWAKVNLKVSNKMRFVTGNKGDKSYMDMQLMTYCKHNIIANSSFSWWGAWLNNNPAKIVIAPQRWFTDDFLNSQTKDLIPKEWKRM